MNGVVPVGGGLDVLGHLVPAVGPDQGGARARTVADLCSNILLLFIHERFFI